VDVALPDTMLKSICSYSAPAILIQQCDMMVRYITNKRVELKFHPSSRTLKLMWQHDENYLLASTFTYILLICLCLFIRLKIMAEHLFGRS
jgi:hypothetical protein